MVTTEYNDIKVEVVGKIGIIRVRILFFPTPRTHC